MFASTLSRPVIVGRQTYTRAAWTGGCRPRPLLLIGPEEARLVRFFFREQMQEWNDFWGDWPDKDTRRIFWGRARFDAHATIRHQKA